MPPTTENKPATTPPETTPPAVAGIDVHTFIALSDTPARRGIEVAGLIARDPTLADATLSDVDWQQRLDEHLATPTIGQEGVTS